MTLAYSFRPILAALSFALASSACSSNSTKSNPDGQSDSHPDITPTIDTSIVIPPDSAGLDAGIDTPPDNAGLDAGIDTPPDSAQAGPRLVITPPFVVQLFIGQAITFNVGNIGDAAVGPLTVRITGDYAADFAATATGCDFVAPFTYCTVEVVFTGTDNVCGGETASLVVTGPAPDFATASVALFGGPRGGPGPLVLSAPSSDLGSVPVGTTGPAVTFTLTKTDGCLEATTGPFTFTLANPEFVVTHETCSTSVLSLGGSCTVSVALRPMSAGPKSAFLSVTAPSGRYAGETVTGTGLAAIDGGVVETMDSGQELGEAGNIAADGGSGN